MTTTDSDGLVAQRGQHGFQGYMELLSDGEIHGWVWDPERPSRHLKVELLANGTVVAEAIANVLRSDLQSANVGDGRHAFRLALPIGVPTEPPYRVRVQETRHLLPVHGDPSWTLKPIAAVEDPVPPLLKRYFDGAFYLAQNPDIAEGSLDPATHYFRSGAAEGRNPTRYFNTQQYVAEFQTLIPRDTNPFVHFLLLFEEGPWSPWRGALAERRLPFGSTALVAMHREFDFNHYLHHNNIAPDAMASSLDGLFHYLSTGWKENFDPSPTFSTSFYLSDNPDVRQSGLNPLLHFVTAGRAEKRKPLPPRYQRAHPNDLGWLQPVCRDAEPPITGPERRDDVTIIVPVYNAPDDVRDLLASLEATTDPHQPVVLVNDASPDETIAPLLDAFGERRPGVRIVTHASNAGFSASVNDGLDAAGGTHVVVLNSDVVLPAGWLRRLMAPIDAESDSVASVTPFSNTSSLTGFPDLATEGPLWLGCDLAEVDTAFRALTPASIELPSACGFCMALSATALARVGGFDAHTFKRGYFEETDWCQRALARGYRHVMATNLFVEHKPGSSSFSVEQRIALSRQNRPHFDTRHPMFWERVRFFRHYDPASSLRRAAKFQLMARLATTRKLLVTHQWGGGATDYVRRSEAEVLAADGLTLNLQLSPSSATVRVRFRDVELVEHAEPTQALAVVLALGFDETEIHALHGSTNILSLVTLLAERLEGRRYSLVMHDFLPVCPTIHLLDFTNTFCGVPDVDRCLECLHRNPGTRYPTVSITHWRHVWERLIRGAEQTVFLDESERTYFTRAFKNLASANTVVRPPQYDPPVRPITAHPPEGDELRIAVLGWLGLHKGVDVVRGLAEHCARHDPACTVTLFGEWGERLAPPKTLTVRGTYKVEDLTGLLEEAGIHVVLFPSICPETFSFTLSEVFAIGLPVVGFDLGAQGRRIREYGKGVVIPRDSSTDSDILSALRLAAKLK